jgi:hypothetical protein
LTNFALVERVKRAPQRKPARVTTPLAVPTVADESHPAGCVGMADNLFACRVKLADLEDNMDIRRLSDVSEEARERLNRYLAAYRRLHGPEP